MARGIGIVAVAAALCAMGAVDAEPSGESQTTEKPAKVSFVKDIEPLLRARCHSCHGPEEQESGLRLDVRKRALEGGDGGAVIVPGKSEKSPLFQRVAGLGDSDRMPPEGKGKPLTTAELALVKWWIDAGAEWPVSGASVRKSSHWAYQPIADPELPRTKNGGWIRNGIDAFILAKLESEGVAPSLEAPRETLIRRLYLDLVGLPPSPAEWEQWTTDEDPDWYKHLVDELLASPHYGERWGRWWLDAARYADSDGFEKDRPRPFAWRWRDWVIRALNEDKPFDQFTIEQLAGDMLPNSTLEQRIATGFHRNTLVNTEGGTDKEEDRVKRTVDRTNTLGAVWLATTIECTQCHSHKYDPFTQREFYSLYAFFNSMDEPDIAAAPRDKVQQYEARLEEFRLQASRLEARLQEFEKKLNLRAGDPPKNIVAILDLPANKRSDKQRQTLQQHFAKTKQFPPYAEALKAYLDHVKKRPVDPRTTLKAQAVAERSTPRETHIHIRGDFLNKGDQVSAGTPEVWPAVKPRGERPDRLDLARWVVSKENPLTARVIVNRVWQQYFGRGIVPSVRDFGTQGDPPSHPELLDWLATRFREDGWSLKKLHRLTVMSATYRQSSAERPELAKSDPYNAWLSHQNRLRVEAEIVRDLALATSGLLSEKVGGPSVRPPQPPGVEKLGYANSVRWATSKGDDRYRRGLYTFFQRTVPYPMLMTFDAPDANITCTRRERSNTPLQALTLWNDPVFFECAQALGRRIAGSADDDAGRIRLAFVLCLGRQPQSKEEAIVARLFEEQVALAKKDLKSAETLVGKAARPEGVETAELAGWILVGRTLMNLDEFITRE